MRQKNETATSFKELKEITQEIQSIQTSDNTNISEIASQSTPKPKSSARAKNHALKPTKKAFSERQITAFRNNSQPSAKKSLETQQSDKQGDNANAFKGDEKNTRGQQ